MSYCKADPKSIPKTLDPAAAATAAAAAAATAHAASLSVGGQPQPQQQQLSSAATAAASGNWKLDDDEGGAGVKMDSTNRANMMSRFGNAAAAAGERNTSYCIYRVATLCEFSLVDVLG